MDKALFHENILQKQNPATIKRQARLIRQRLQLMKPALWQMIAEGSKEVATQALLASAIKHSLLLGDFMYQVVKEQWITFERQLSPLHWNRFMDMCRQVDPHVLEWSDSTVAKLRQVIFRILAESGYIDNTRSLKLQHVSIVPEVRNYLLANSEDYVIRCMEVTEG